MIEYKDSFDTYDSLVRNLHFIMSGDFDDVMKEDLEKGKRIGFLINNLTIDKDSDMAIFESGDIVIEIGHVVDGLHREVSFMSEDLHFENFLLELFLRQKDFKKAFKIFESNYK